MKLTRKEKLEIINNAVRGWLGNRFALTYAIGLGESTGNVAAEIAISTMIGIQNQLGELAHKSTKK